TEGRFETARDIMAESVRVLNTSHLTIRCDRSRSVWGEAFAEKYAGSAVYYTIELGRPWLDGPAGMSALELAGERQLTLVHEAAHHGGANAGEFLARYGLDKALKRAKSFPGTAVRTAENHAYYAVCRASASPACSPP